MIVFKFDYQLPNADLGFDVDLSKLVFSVVNVEDFNESYEVDEGGFLYQQKLTDAGQISGVEKMEDYTGTVFLNASINGEIEDCFVFYKVEFAKGKVLDAKFVESVKIDANYRKSMIKSYAISEERSKKWWFRFLYVPYSEVVGFCCKVMLGVIYYTSMVLMKILKWVFDLITPYG